MRKSLSFRVSLGEVLYDAANKTYLIERSREDVDGLTPEAAYAIAVNGEDEDMNQLKYSFLQAIASLRTHMAEYASSVDVTAMTKEGNVVSLDDGVVPADVVFAFEMPSNFDDSLMESVAVMAHSYVVAMCVGDWLNITSATDAAAYYSQASGSADSIRLTMNRRKRPVKKSGHEMCCCDGF